jgi:Protein of unknown function (DUF3499)
MGCRLRAVATIGIAYAERTVVVTDLAVVPDPNLVDLCARHADRLSPPRGWMIRDERTIAAVSPG